ncbi:MAG: hypothetical protein Ct9H300mP13_0590 [Gammaproteobacteria bacterium]|nr:MAG: hypothetical protein Ct9H300mP13_0590 [Gammaproteobacteria bacterium]
MATEFDELQVRLTETGNDLRHYLEGYELPPGKNMRGFRQGWALCTKQPQISGAPGSPQGCTGKKLQQELAQPQTRTNN